jgi:hypothetical protein
MTKVSNVEILLVVTGRSPNRRTGFAVGWLTGVATAGEADGRPVS